MRDKHQIVEEPCEGKFSCTVLKTSGTGDSLAEFNKSLSPAARLKLIGELKLGTKVKPTRRVWIPKPGKQEKRPLGIPTMADDFVILHESEEAIHQCHQVITEWLREMG